MKNVKMLGLVGLATLMLAATAGVSQVSAVTLCKTNVKTASECAEPYPAVGTVISSSLKAGTTAVVTTKGGLVNPTITCTKASGSGTTTGITGSPTSLTGITEKVVFEGCTDSITGGTCTAQALNKPVSHLYTTEVGAVHANGNGRLEVTEAEATFNCPKLKEATGAGHCIYRGSGIVHVTGGNPAMATGTNQKALRVATDFGCPPEAFGSATAEVTSPKPLFVI